MYIGQILMICALVATALGAFMPMFKLVRVSAPIFFAFLVLETLASFINPFLYAMMLVVPAFLLALKLRWAGGVVLAIVCAFGAAVVSLAGLYFFNIVESGFVCGSIACFVCIIFGKHTRIRLCSALLVAPLTLLLFNVLSPFLHFGAVFNNGSFIDLAAASVIISFVASAAIENFKSRKRNLDIIPKIL